MAVSWISKIWLMQSRCLPNSRITNSGHSYLRVNCDKPPTWKIAKDSSRSLFLKLWSLDHGNQNQLRCFLITQIPEPHPRSAESDSPQTILRQSKTWEPTLDVFCYILLKPDNQRATARKRNINSKLYLFYIFISEHWPLYHTIYIWLLGRSLVFPGKKLYFYLIHNSYFSLCSGYWIAQKQILDLPLTILQYVIKCTEPTSIVWYF